MNFDSVGYVGADEYESFVVLMDSRADAVSRVLSVEWLEEGDRPSVVSGQTGMGTKRARKHSKKP